MEKEKFETLVEEALKSIPLTFKKYLQNIAVIVEENPPSPYRTVLGLYHGVPFKHRGPYYGNMAPDVIVIYQRPIERICSSGEEIKKKLKEVVLHEVGHYFGLSEEELREIEEQL